MAIGLLVAAPLAAAGCGSDDAARIQDYAVTFSVTSDSGSLAALHFDVRYLDGNGGWAGSAGNIPGNVVCSTLVDVALATYNDRGNGFLSAAIIDLEGFDTPNPMSTCILRAADPPTAQSFAITVIDASTPDGGNPTPFPFMQVTSITVVDDAPGFPTTTFASTASDYEVTVSVTNDSGLLAALQFDIRYLDGNGGWLGSGGSVLCTTLVDVELATYNDRGRAWLSAAMIDLEGFDVPNRISTCVLRAAEVPTVESFEVTVIDASTPDTTGPDGGRPGPFPIMEVTSIVERDSDATPGDTAIGELGSVTD